MNLSTKVVSFYVEMKLARKAEPELQRYIYIYITTAAIKINLCNKILFLLLIIFLRQQQDNRKKHRSKLNSYSCNEN